MRAPREPSDVLGWFCWQASDLKRHENNMHSERKLANPLQSDTEALQAAAMAAEESHMDNMSCS